MCVHAKIFVSFSFPAVALFFIRSELCLIVSTRGPSASSRCGWSHACHVGWRPAKRQDIATRPKANVNLRVSTHNRRTHTLRARTVTGMHGTSSSNNNNRDHCAEPKGYAARRSSRDDRAPARRVVVGWCGQKTHRAAVGRRIARSICDGSHLTKQSSRMCSR